MPYARFPFPLASPEEKRLTDITAELFIPPAQPFLDAIEQILHTSQIPHERAVILMMQAANEFLDEEGRQIATIFAQQNNPVVCHAGCWSCCCQLVYSTPFDAILIRHYLANHPEIAHRFEAAYAQWDAATASMRPDYLRWAERYWREGVDDGSHHFQEYFVRCVFLDEKDQCSVYPVRPYCCRSCITVDPACHTPVTPQDVPGMRNMLYGNHTQHKVNREILTDLLWRSFGIEPERAAFIPMVELVHHLLHHDLPTTLAWATRP